MSDPSARSLKTAYDMLPRTMRAHETLCEIIFEDPPADLPAESVARWVFDWEERVRLGLRRVAASVAMDMSTIIHPKLCQGCDERLEKTFSELERRMSELAEGPLD